MTGEGPSQISELFPSPETPGPTTQVDLYDMDFGWGRPMKIEDISIDKSRAISLHESRDVKGGIEVGIVLPKPTMDAFASLFKAGLKVTEQKAIDDFLIKLDGTANKTKLGANAILGVSIAVAKAGAEENGVPLYKHIAALAGVKAVEEWVRKRQGAKL